MTLDNALKIGIACYPSIGGSGVIATTLGIELSQRGHEVHFISYERPFRLPQNAPRIYFHQVAINDYGLFKYPDYTLPLSVKMAEVSRSHKLDIMHVHYAVPHATAAILAHCMLEANQQPKVVTTLHGTDTTLLGKDPGYGPAILHALNHSDAVTTVSEFLKSESRRVLKFDGPMDVIYNFFEPGKPSRSRENVRAELGIGEKAMILHSSNLRPAKRIDLLLETVARIKNKDSFKLVILAGGKFAPFEEEVRRLNLQDNVIVKENVLEIEDYLQAADIGLITSESESFCLSILEAMYFACPSVATNVGGIPEVVKDGETGLLIPSICTKDGTNEIKHEAVAQMAQSMATAVERLIDDVPLRIKLGRNSQIDAQKRFSANSIVPQYERLYRAQIGLKEAQVQRIRAV